MTTSPLGPGIILPGPTTDRQPDVPEIRDATTPKRSELLRAALKYAEAGKPVFPCKPGGKRPLTKHGHLDATTDPRRITAWWTRWPQANIGMPTGKPSGIVVLDNDIHKKGAWTLEETEKNLGPLGDYMLVRSGSGGLQLWYLRPEGDLRNGIAEDVLGPGVCIKADGGYVVVAPSVTSNPYEVLEGEPGTCAGWLDAALRDVKGEVVPRGVPGLVPKGAGHPGHAPRGRNTALTSIAGSLNDGTRDLPTLTADLATVRDERWPDFPDAEVAKIARSIHPRPPCRPRAKRAPEAVQRALVAFGRKVGAMTWPGHSSNRLSLLKTYALLARRHGAVHENGVAISVSNSQAALHNGCSDRAVRRNNAKLVEAGLIRSDNEDRAPMDSGTIVLLVGQPERQDNPTEPRSVLTQNPPGFVVGEDATTARNAGGGGLGQNAAPAAWSAVRGRHGKPLYDRGEMIGFLGRMGKRAELAVDELEEAGGRLHERELASFMGIKRARNMNGSAWLTRLLDAGVVERDGDGYLALTDDWLAAWDRRRVEDEEEMDRERDRERYRRLSVAWAERVAEHEEKLHAERLHRMAHLCHDGEIPVEADGLIAELEPVEDALQEPADGTGRVGQELSKSGAAAADLARSEPGPRPDPGYRPTTAEISSLAAALGRYLVRSPRRAGEAPSWLANCLWSEELVEGKPTPEAVAEALDELERAGRAAVAA